MKTLVPLLLAATNRASAYFPSVHIFQLICSIALNSSNTLEKKDDMIYIPNYVNNIYF